MSLKLNTLRIRITAAVLLILTPALILILFNAETERARAVAQAQTDALALTERIAEANRQHIDSTRVLLTALAQLPFVKNHDPDGCMSMFQRLMPEFNQYIGIFAINTDTDIVFCTTISQQANINVNQIAWYRSLLDTHQFTVSQYRITMSTQQPALTLGMPVYDDDGTLVAAVGASISLQWLNQFIQNQDLPPDSTVTLTDATGVVVARYPDSTLADIGEPYPLDAVRDAALSSDHGTMDMVGTDGIPRLYSFASFGADSGSLHAVVGFSDAVILAAAADNLNRNIIEMAGISIVVISFVWVGTGLLLKPINQLTRTIRQITGGQLNSRLVQETRIVELKDLVVAVNEMAGVLEKDNLRRMDDLASANARLREEIDERTQAQARTRILQELSAGLAEALTAQQVAQMVIERGLRPIGSHYAVLTLHQPGSDSLQRLNGVSESPDDPRALIPLISVDPLAVVFHDHTPQWIETRSRLLADYPHALDDAVPSIHAVAYLPLMFGKLALGTMMVAFPNARVMGDVFRTLLTTIAAYTAQTLERVQLHEQAQEAAMLHERQRFARDLHDAVSQTLFSAASMAEALSKQWDASPERAQDLLQQIVLLNRSAMAEMRTLLLELRPESVSKTPLTTLLRQLIDAAKGRRDIAAELTISGTPGTLPTHVQETFYRIAQESINNILKHSEAEHFAVRFEATAHEMTLTIVDDGIGFDPQQQLSGFGLNNIRERAEAVGAQIVISSQPGDGSEIRLTWQRLEPDLPETPA